MPANAGTVAGDRQQLRLFMAHSRSRLQALLEQLQWTEAGVKAEHRAEVKKTLTTEELPPSCCSNPAFSVQLDKATVRSIMGRDAALASDTQRLQLYELVLERTAKHPPLEEENAAFAELVGMTKRDQQKRRRHRKSKPTLNEELRQLVELQMEALQRQHAAAAREPVFREKRRRSRSPEKRRHCQSEKRERDREQQRQHSRKQRSRSRSRSRSSHYRRHRSRDRH